MIRAFVAVELPAELRSAMGQLQGELQRRLRKDLPPGARLQWVRPEAIHLTLKFLGDIDESQVEAIRIELAPRLAAVRSFVAEAGGLGVFPDLRQPRVLWLGLVEQGDRSKAFADVVRLIDDACEPLGFLRETRAFTPHLTLARIKAQSREIGRALAHGGVMTMAGRLGRLPVTTVVLMKSELKPSGAVYARLWTAPLGVSIVDS